MRTVVTTKNACVYEDGLQPLNTMLSHFRQMLPIDWYNVEVKHCALLQDGKK